MPIERLQVTLVVAATCALLTMAGTAAAQTAGAPAAPKDRAADITDERLDQAVRELIERKLITQRMLEGGVFSVNVRHISGAETALQHGRITELWVVRDGHGIVATGGTLASSYGSRRGSGLKP